MPKKCIACGKNMSLITPKVNLFEYNAGLEFCKDCFDKMPKPIKDLHYFANDLSKNDIAKIKDSVIREMEIMEYNSESINVITQFLDNKISIANEEIDNSNVEKITQDCPICKNSVPYIEGKCSKCGYVFGQKHDIPLTKIAEAYNVRDNQYLSNALYEYDIIVVKNERDGSVNKTEISKSIVEHCLQGWRLITMYSNELGKTGVTIKGVNTNVTMCENILVFERCIKANGNIVT